MRTASVSLLALALLVAVAVVSASPASEHLAKKTATNDLEIQEAEAAMKLASRRTAAKPVVSRRSASESRGPRFTPLGSTVVSSEKEASLLTHIAAQKVMRRAVCPNSCSLHGACNTQTGVCSCQSGWAGSDCSYNVVALTSGVKVSGQSVSRGDWIFFTIVTRAGNGLTVLVNQSTATADVDLYMNPGAIPSFSKYLYKDITTKQNFGVEVDDAGNGTWYIGLYGYTDATFDILATSGSQCPNLNNCNGNGVCVGPDVCTCSAGWAMDDCSAPLRTLTLSQPVTERVETRKWIYYQLALPTASPLLQILVHQTTTGDVDMYVKKGSLPKIYDYDYRDVTLDADFNISIAQPPTGTWYIGLYGFGAASFTLTAQNQNTGCASQCSLHGQCIVGRCVCNTGFSGVYCENMDTSIGLNTPWVEGLVDDNAWNYYHTESLLASRGVAVYVQQLATPNPGFVDCDLYIRQGSKPTRFDYDFRDIGIAASFNVTITNPGTTGWYFGVYGYSQCHYQIQVRETVTGCPNSCSGQGTCLANGQCQCNQGFAGASCQQAVVALVNGAAGVSGTVGPNQWNYFSLQLSASTYFVADVFETSSTGDVWLFATKAPGVPTIRQSEYSDQATNKNFHTIHVQLNDPTTETWVFGVYGSPLIGTGSTADFKIAAWTPPF